MQITKTKDLLRISSALILLTLFLTLFTSCFPEQRMPTKEELNENISDVLDNEELNYQYVHLYLRDMGITNYNVSKFLWVEERFIKFFNLKSGLPAVSDHAELVAKDFIENYYDKTDLNDRDDVTDALITCYVNALGDPYSIYRTPTEQNDYSTDMSGKFGGIGVVIEYDHQNETLRVTTVYIDSPAEDAGIEPGDYIYAVNGKSVDDVGYLNVIDYVRGEIGSSVTVTVKRGEETLDFEVTRAEIEEKTVAYSINEDNLGYVQIVGFKGNTFAQFAEAIDALEAAGVGGVIFDLRGNPGGYVDAVCDMISYLIPTGHTIVTYQYKDQIASGIKSEDDIHPTKKDPSDASKPLKTDHVYNVPMVVLCDEYTASAGELFTAAVRDFTKMGILSGKTVGHTTYGKGIMQSSWAYYDSSSVTLTVAYYNPPSGVNYHGEGIIPDREATNEIHDGVLVDKQLEAATEELKALINNN